MNKILYFIFAICLCAGCSGTSNKHVTILGHVVDYDPLEYIYLYKTVNGNRVEIAKTKVASDGFYGFVFQPEEEGVYAIGNVPQDIYHVYLKEGSYSEINLHVDRMELVKTNSPEMEVFYNWYLLSRKADLIGVRFMKKHGMTYEDFFPVFEELQVKVDDFKKKIHTGNPSFDEFMPKIIRYDLDYIALSMLSTPRSKHPAVEEIPSYYDTVLNKEKLTNMDVMRLPYGMRLLDMYMMYYSKLHGLKTPLKEMIEAITDNYQLRGEIVLENAKRHKFYEDYLRMLEDFGVYFVTNDQKARAEAIGSKLYDPEEGKIAANFTYPDVNGKMVSLSDFKGKVVLVDVWATWCGPCRGEIPYLKKLEEEMRGKNVAFVGVSLDVEKDKEKWKNTVKEEGLKGVQLIAIDGFKSKIAGDYKIKGIPRFMVFDKTGNIASFSAPRPSDPRLKELLLKTLNKGK